MKKIFSIPKIHCTSCVMLLETLEEDYDGITDVKVDLIKREVKIDYDDRIITPESLIRAIKQISGYEAVINAA